MLILLWLRSCSTSFAFKTADVGQPLAVGALRCLIFVYFSWRSNIPHVVNCKGVSNMGFSCTIRIPWERKLVTRTMNERCAFAGRDFILVKTLHSRYNVCVYTLKSYAFCNLQGSTNTGWHSTNVLCCFQFPNKWMTSIQWRSRMCSPALYVGGPNFETFFPKIVYSEECFTVSLIPPLKCLNNKVKEGHSRSLQHFLKVALNFLLYLSTLNCINSLECR